MEIQQLVDRHNNFKKKGLLLTESDLFDWVALWEDMLDTTTTLRSEYQEEKQQLDVDKGLMVIDLKSQLDDKGKKIHTESTCDATINQKFFDKNKELQAIKLKTELLQNKTTVIGEYINIVKKILAK